MASTSNIQNGTLSFSSYCSEYEVFLSFGGDTRNNFTDHLYRALAFDKGIITFRDKEGLDRGKPISPELLNAIGKSKIAVVILSENYASSTWCLEELANILEYVDAGRMRVLPIFYHVDPSDVRHLKGTFAAAFAKHVLAIFHNVHDQRFKEKKMQRWSAALRRVADLSGHHLKDEPESEFIHNFVEVISSELNGTIQSVFNDKYVGIDSRVQEIMDLYIGMASNDVRFIGICGMSGIGKTTLAEVVFDRIHRQFEASSFLRDVKRLDLGDSQDQLLRDMKLKSEIPRWDVLKGIKATSLRLRNKKVIIVLDDVEEEKLEKLAGHHYWFGLGSRIIIITEDEGLLEKRCEKKYVYKAKKLNASDGLQLFCREAFGKPCCDKYLLDICNGFVSCVDGHPLALIILGSSMHDIPIYLWKAEMKRLRESAQLPNDRIITALRIRKGGDKVTFSFSDSADVSFALECGVNLVHQRNMEDFKCTMVQILTSYIDQLYLIHNPVYRSLAISHDEVRGTGNSYEEDPRPQWPPISPKETGAGTAQYSYEEVSYPQWSLISGEETGAGTVTHPSYLEDPHSHNQFYRTGPLDFHPSLYYNSCFPPSRVTQEWFSPHSGGHSVTIGIPPNLCKDNNWMGLALCASFSMGGDQETIIDNLVSEIPHLLYCQFGTSVSSLDDESFACQTSRAEIMWLINQGGFIWISCVPGELVKNMLRQYSHIEASFVSDWPGVMMQKCALRLLYQRDQVPFEQNLKQCNALISENSNSVRQFRADQEKRNEQNHIDHDEAGPRRTTSSNEGYLSTRPIYQDKTNEDFDRCLTYNSCFPRSEIVDWFSHPSDGPRVTIHLPPNLYNDTTWTGVALFASFSVLNHSTTFVGSLDPQVHCHFVFRSQKGVMWINVAYSYCLTEEDLSLLKLGGFMWLSCIPRGRFPKWLNGCSSIEAEIRDCPGLMVHKYGLHLLYQNDEVEFKETIRLCKASFSNHHENRAKASNNNSTKEEFDQCLVYNSCFPPNEIMEWFWHRSGEPQVTIPLPPNLYDDPTWMGLALCVSFSVHEHGTTIVDNLDSHVPCDFIICVLETDICGLGHVHMDHMYCLTKEDLMLLRLSGFIWLSYIPRGSFPKWLIHSSFIEASIATDCLGLTVQKCGFRLLYENEEIELKETIRQLSQTRDVSSDQLTIANENPLPSSLYYSEKTKKGCE